MFAAIIVVGLHDYVYRGFMLFTDLCKGMHEMMLCFCAIVIRYKDLTVNSVDEALCLGDFVMQWK